MADERTERPEPPLPQLTGAPAPRRSTTLREAISVNQAVAEITARRRVLDGEADMKTPPARSAAAPPPPAAPRSALPEPPAVPAGERTPIPAPDVDLLDNLLRRITAKVDALQPQGGVEQAVAAMRTDLAEIGRQITAASPRAAVESLELEIKALADRIDRSRQPGVDANALAGLERGLTEVREALHSLTPAENLVDLAEAVSALTQKVDLIIARDDPNALHQLQAAIGGLNGVLSHVASNETLARLAEEVRALAAQAGGGANAGANGNAVAALEQRIDTLTAALNASTEAGHAVPRELERLLAGLIEKLEWVQLTHTDHAVLAHLEDRIATLVKRFDASDTRLGHVEAIERGLADLLVHLEQMRSSKGSDAGTASFPLPAVSLIQSEVVEIKHSERRIQDSLEAVQGIIEQVVERLATIESGLRNNAAPPPGPAAASRAEPEPVPAAPAISSSSSTASGAVLPDANAAPAEPPASRTTSLRPPIDPSLPPDHPLEPGVGMGRTRLPASAAQRIATSEAAIGLAKPPVVPDAGRPNFIEAARRAAQAAARDSSGNKAAHAGGQDAGGSRPNTLSQRLRKLMTAGGAVLILAVGARVGVRMFEDGPSIASHTRISQISRPAEPATVSVAANKAPVDSRSLPAVIRIAGAPPATIAATKNAARAPQATTQATAQPKIIPVPPFSAAEPTGDAMALWSTPDITGALAPINAAANNAAPAAALPAAASTGVADDTLPAAIGNPALRAAAKSGDPAAAYAVATRFAEGSGVTQNDELAARWLERAAKRGLTMAQFRLGGFYEKGIGVEKNLAQARDLYLAAAEKGNGKAMHNLAVLYAEGINGPPDYHNAAIWFGKAADHGIEDSQYNLGILYARGIGVDRSDVKAYKWFALAAKQGDHEAAKKRDILAGKLDKHLLATARAALAKWSPEPQPEAAISVRMPAAWSAPAKQLSAARPVTRLPGSALSAD